MSESAVTKGEPTTTTHTKDQKVWAMAGVTIIEATSASELTYEEGLLRIANKAPKVGLDLFSEEVLIKHAEAVIEQIQSYEEAEDVEIQEIMLMNSHFVKSLMDYAGKIVFSWILVLYATI